MNYTVLLKAWLQEMREDALQSLSQSFYQEVGAYIGRLREEVRMMEKGMTRSRIIKIEKVNVEKMIGDLFELRWKKLLSSLFSGEKAESERLTREERHLLLNLEKVFLDYHENLKSILRGQVPEVKAKSSRSRLKVIRILEHIPSIIGMDMKTYGPFKPEDVAAIPVRNAENLIRRGLALEVEEGSL